MSQPQQSFLMILRPGREGFPENATEKEIALVGEHFQYLTRYFEAEKVVLFGRTDEAKPMGLVVIRNCDLAEAEEIMKNDPAVSNGVMTAELKEFRLAYPK